MTLHTTLAASLAGTPDPHANPLLALILLRMLFLAATPSFTPSRPRPYKRC